MSFSKISLVITSRKILKAALFSFICFLSGWQEVLSQDTLYFRDNSYAIARLKRLGFKKISYLLLTESGDSAVKTDQSSRLDSIHFQNGSVFKQGQAFSGTGLPEVSAYAAFWEGMRDGQRFPSFRKSQIAWNYIAGISVVGLPFTLTQALRKVPSKNLPEPIYQRTLTDPAYSKGFRNGLNKTRLTVLLPVYLAGTLSTILGLAVFSPR